MLVLMDPLKHVEFIADIFNRITHITIQIYSDMHQTDSIKDPIKHSKFTKKICRGK